MYCQTNTQGRAGFYPTARGTTLLERGAAITKRHRQNSIYKKLVPTKNCRDEFESVESRGTTLLGRITPRPARTPLTKGQFGECTPASRPFHPSSPGLAFSDLRAEALAASGASSLPCAQQTLKRIRFIAFMPY